MTPSSARLLALLLAAGSARAEPAVAQARLLAPELSAQVGALGLGYTHAGGRWGDGFFAAGLSGRTLFGGFVVDGELFTATPTRAEGAGFTGTAGLRLGWSGERWAVLAGALVQWTPGAQPAVQLWPTLHARYSFGAVGLSTGLFEEHGLALAHLTLDTQWVSVGYVPPLGVRAVLHLPGLQPLGLEVRALAYRLANTEVALLTLAGTLEPAKEVAP